MGEETEAISGRYSFQQEGKIPYKDRDIYYYTGYSAVDTSCCGPGGCGFALVIGYIVNWKNGKDAGGIDTSDIEPVTNDGDRQDIKKLLTKETHVQQVNFWTPHK